MDFPKPPQPEPPAAEDGPIQDRVLDIGNHKIPLTGDEDEAIRAWLAHGENESEAQDAWQKAMRRCM